MHINTQHACNGSVMSSAEGRGARNGEGQEVREREIQIQPEGRESERETGNVRDGERGSQCCFMHRVLLVGERACVSPPPESA